jgi:hypothetical protein
MIAGVEESSNEFEKAENCPSLSIQLAMTDRDQLSNNAWLISGRGI